MIRGWLGLFLLSITVYACGSDSKQDALQRGTDSTPTVSSNDTIKCGYGTYLCYNQCIVQWLECKASNTSTSTNNVADAGSSNGYAEPPSQRRGEPTEDYTKGEPVGADEPAYPQGSVQPKSSEVHVLDYRVVDAEFDAAHSRIVAVSGTPTKALHLIDVTSLSDRIINLPSAPIAVSVDAGGHKAAVAYNADVSLVDLDNGVVVKTCPLDTSPFDVALTSQGIAYVMPRESQWQSLRRIDLTNCTTTKSPSPIYSPSYLKLHPAEIAIFTAEIGVSSEAIIRCDLQTSHFVCDYSTEFSPYWEKSACGNLWMSSDGQRIYTACGATQRIPGDVIQSPCTYGGTLAHASHIQHLADAIQAKRVAFIPHVDGRASKPNPNEDTVVVIDETDFLGFVAAYQIPRFPTTPGHSAVSHGQFVFTTPTMDSLYIIARADASSGANKDFAIVKIIP